VTDARARSRSSVAVAAEGKGRLNLVRRVGAICSHYGVRPHRMERRLATVLELTERYGCSATLPVTAAAFDRHPEVITHYSDLGIEFAVHGYHHHDHVGMTAAEQIEHLGRARQLLEAHGLPVIGFRAPYLRWNASTMLALRETGYLYDSSQAMYRPCDPRLETEDYGRVLTFYGALSAEVHPVLPRLEDGLVRIPVTLPDDESLIDRLGITSPEAIVELWLKVLQETRERGELFTLQVHPERIDLCARGVAAVLEAARAARPAVWIARLDEIARWWRRRAATQVTVRDAGDDHIEISVPGTSDARLLARQVSVPGGTPWADGSVIAPEARLVVRARPRPFIGVHPSSPGSLTSFLRQQGYIVEPATTPADHAVFLHRERFAQEDELRLLSELETASSPLVRLSRWPAAARAAVVVTGDVDALTLWDYAFRVLGR